MTVRLEFRLVSGNWVIVTASGIEIFDPSREVITSIAFSAIRDLQLDETGVRLTDRKGRVLMLDARPLDAPTIYSTILSTRRLAERRAPDDGG